MKKDSKKVDLYSYKGWMNSDSFLKRCFGVWGHMFVAHLIIALGVFAVMIVFWLIIVLIIVLIGGATTLG